MAMEIDLSREISKIHTSWNDRYFDFKNNHSKNSLDIFGERGCGKTHAAQEYVRTHTNKARYFSFANLAGNAAIKAFANAFQLEKEKPTSWNEVGKLFHEKYGKQAMHILLDDLEFFPQRNDLRIAIDNYIARGRIVVSELRRCIREDWNPNSISFVSVFIGRRTLSDYCKYFPTYSKQDILRLFSMTGGVLAILKEIDEKISFEENLKYLLRYDSAFSRFLPEWLGEYFRTPESYYPILCSMANGKHRLSEIAQDAGYPTNKCQTYLRALIHAHLVRQESLRDQKQSTYHLTSSYIAAWFLYVYGRRSEQVSDPDGLFHMVLESIDEKLALPAFYKSCFRYLEMSTKEYLYPYSCPSTDELTLNVPYKFKDGYRLKLNYCVKIDGQTLIVILPETLNTKYTKWDIKHITAAVNHFDTIYGTDIVVFSLNRFSDWCVHEASKNYLLHLVTIERLRY